MPTEAEIDQALSRLQATDRASALARLERGGRGAAAWLAGGAGLATFVFGLTEEIGRDFVPDFLSSFDHAFMPAVLAAATVWILLDSAALIVAGAAAVRAGVQAGLSVLDAVVGAPALLARLRRR